MNADRFLKAYNQIDDNLRELLGIERGRWGFAYVVDQAAKRHSVVRRYADDLKEYGALRNAIVHDRDYPTRVIAEPHIEVVETLERLVTVILNPPRVFPLFSRDVRRLEADDPVGKLLRFVRQQRYSQFPVFRGHRFVGLLTSRCIAEWLADSVTNGSVTFDGVTVEDVLAHGDPKGRDVEFVSKEATWYDAAERFTPGPGKRRVMLEAILITETGRESEQLLGIITPRDLLSPPGGLS